LLEHETAVFGGSKYAASNVAGTAVNSKNTGG
jgi:hypothetical protein